MVADKGKKLKLSEKGEEENNSETIDEKLVLSIEKLQEIQDELEKVYTFIYIYMCVRV
jgi:template-activating factor I